MKIKIAFWLVLSFLGLAGYIKIDVEYGFKHLLFCIGCFVCVVVGNKIQQEIARGDE